MTAHTLTGGHAVLLRQVRAYADRVLATVTSGRHPAAELAALTEFARSALSRQVADEEALLSAAGLVDVSGALARDHARLRSCVGVLARAASGEQDMSAAQLSTITRDFVAQLERHLRAEELSLAALSVSKAAL